MNQKALLDELDEKKSLTQVQDYIRKVVEIRGFADQPVQETMLLLLEETGELAKAIRKVATKMSVDPERMQNYDTVESVVADVFFVLTAICNQMNINLFDALKAKERVNCERNWGFDRE